MKECETGNFFELDIRDSFSSVVKDFIKVKKIDNAYCDEFDDFEIKFLEGNEITIASKFASKVSFILDQKCLKNEIKILIKNGLFLDTSGYCHKIKLDEVVTFKLIL